MNNQGLTQIANWFRVSIISELKKLITQKIAFLYLLFFLGSEFIMIMILIFYHYQIAPLTDAAGMLEKFHSFFFDFLLTLIIIFSGSQQICREYETGVIKNIALTGIPMPVYLMARLGTFLALTISFLFVAYIFGLIGSLIFWGRNLDITLLVQGFFFNSLNLIYAFFTMIMVASLIKDTRKSIQYLLIYYIGFEKILIGGILSLQSLLNIPEPVIVLAKHTPMRILDNLQGGMGTPDMFLNMGLLLAFLFTYGSITWFKSLNFQFGLLKR